MEWFEKGAAQGNDRASYSLGYMYYKGLGVDQDYTTAVQWFKKSKDPMAEHWLGVCYYFGYGVVQNTETAVGYLSGNGTPNSRNFLRHVKAHQKEKMEKEVLKIEQEVAQSPQKIATTVLEKAPELITHDALLEDQDLVGAWIGKLIEYDESGSIVQRILPIEITFILNDVNTLQTEINFNKETLKNQVLFEDNNLYVDNFKFTLKKQYTHNPKYPNLTYQMLGMDFSKQTHNGLTYLLADVDAYIDVWKEIAPPMSLVLRPKNQEDISKEEEAKLIALAQQKDQFIKLYPVPFQSQLHIAFNLEQAETVKINITNLNQPITKVIEPGKLLQKGAQTYHMDASGLTPGMYVIKISTQSKTHTRIVIKQ